MATAKAADDRQSRNHRLKVGDNVTYSDSSEWPPIHMEGVIEDFTNVELTYLSVDFGEHGKRELTEDDVTRV